jgi:putative transposase
VCGKADEQLWEHIERIYQASGGTYGSPRIHAALKAQGSGVGKKRVERSMRKHGLRARSAKLYHANPGSHAFFASIPNRQLGVIADRADRVWVGDITYLKVGGQWRYLAIVIDKYSRRVVGWSLGRHKDVALTLASLNRAVFHRRPGLGVIFHTDRGIEYAGYAFRDRLTQLGFVQSMNRPGKLTDNAHMGSFFHSMKSDVVRGVVFEQEKELQKMMRSYIPFYNQKRLHSSLGYLSTVQYEPHVHVDRDNLSAKFWLQPAALARNFGFPAHELRRIRILIEEHQTRFLEVWNGHIGTQR